MVEKSGHRPKWVANLRPGFATVFLAIAGVYLLIQPTEFNTTDGAVRELVAKNLLYEHDFALRQVEEGEFYNDMWSIGRDGRPYTYFGLGQSLMEIPFLVLIDWAEALGIARFLRPYHGLPVVAVMLISSALIGAFVFGIVRQLGYRTATALRVTALAAFGSILWGLSRQSYDMVQEAMGVTGAVYFAIAAQKSTGPWRWVQCAAAGLLYGMALITRASAVVAAPALALLALGSPNWAGWRERAKAALWCAAGGLALAWIVPAYNCLRFENPFSFGYSGHRPYPGGPLLPGLAVWLFSPWQGVLVYMPVLLALPFAWRPFGRRHGHVLGAVVVLFAAYLVFYAQLTGLGSYGWGPYYLLAGVLPLYILFAELFEHWQALTGWQRLITIALMALSVLVQLPSLTVPSERYQSYLVVAKPDLPQEVLNWSLEWSPIRLQAEGTLVAFRNLPRWRDFIYSPSQYDAATLLAEYYAYNAPDWWWLFRLLHGSETSLAVPLTASVCAVWLLVHLSGIKSDRTAVPQAGNSHPNADSTH